MQGIGEGSRNGQNCSIDRFWSEVVEWTDRKMQGGCCANQKQKFSFPRAKWKDWNLKRQDLPISSVVYQGH